MPPIAADKELLLKLRAVLETAMETARHMVPTHLEQKAHQDHVTDVDLALDRHLQAALAPLVPGVPVLSEERAVQVTGSCAAWWMVDPIDGTANLIAGLPFVGISVALVDAAGPCLAGVASLSENKVWLALRGGGGFVAVPGETPVRLQLPAHPPELLVLSTGLLDALVQAGGRAWTTLRAMGKIRNLGAQSLHLAGVAAGRFAAVASVEARVWDEAGGGLILREAGGIWRSVADDVDWQLPAEVMAIREQHSIGCHPSVEAALSVALEGYIIRGKTASQPL